MIKIPDSPPDFVTLAERAAGDATKMVKIVQKGRPVDSQGRYLHWDQMRRRTPPAGQSLEDWWLSTAFARRVVARPLPLRADSDDPFIWSNIDEIQKIVHLVDREASGQILADDVVTSLRSSDRYLVSSLVEEAITSSQLEGASTTRHVAKEMLRTGRKPRDRSEQMIVNNYVALVEAEKRALRPDPLTVEDILDIHRKVTEDAIDDPADAGRIQGPDEERICVRWTNDLILHRPPPAETLPQRLQEIVDFANGVNDENYIHPVVRAITVHFMIGYDHPFVDGNGRTARAMFYLIMLRSGYWLAQYLSISSILRKAPSKYAKSYLYVETDGNDLTYFIVYQLSVIQRSIEGLKEYLSRKVSETRRVERMLKGVPELNHRQLEVVGRALRDQTETSAFTSHARRHGVTYQTARTDLLGLVELGLFEKVTRGNRHHFVAVSDFVARADRLNARM